MIMKSNNDLIASLKDIGVLRSKKIEHALLDFPREEFIPAAEFHRAYEDRPLPIGQGQTISQPRTVVFMLELLDARAGDNVLDIGAGSGWVSALLSHLVGSKGHVWAYEFLPEIGEFGIKNLSKFNLRNVDYIIGNAREHWGEHAPYKRIISGAGFEEIPEELKDLLKVGAWLVAPTQNHDIRLIVRVGEKKFIEKEYLGFEFVPFIAK